MKDMAGSFRFAGADDQPELAEAQKIAEQLNKLSGVLQKAVIGKMQKTSKEPLPEYLKRLCRLQWAPCQKEDGQQAVEALIDRARIGILAHEWLLSEEIVIAEKGTIAHAKGQEMHLVIELFEFNNAWRQKAMENANAEAFDAASQGIMSAVFSKAPTVN